MCRIPPDHQRIVRGSCCQDGLFHASSNCGQFVPVEWNRQVGYLSKVLSFFLLNAHFEDLTLGRGVNKELPKLFHSRDCEVRLPVLFFQVLIPLHVVVIDRHRQIALEQFKRVP
jgi:hypothetical protein